MPCVGMPIEAGERALDSPELVTSSCEPPDVGAGETNAGPLEKRRVLLTIEPPLQAHLFLHVCGSQAEVGAQILL